MNISKEIQDFIISSESKALATIGTDLKSLNVVPVSTIKISGDKILLVNYFMGKTLENIQNNSRVCFTCWKGLSGYKVNATVEHITEGEIFDSIKTWVAEILPDRTVRGVLILTPTDIFDISATAKVPGKKIESD